MVRLRKCSKLQSFLLLVFMLCGFFCLVSKLVWFDLEFFDTGLERIYLVVCVFSTFLFLLTWFESEFSCIEVKRNRLCLFRAELVT